jgi:hypothetical protein
MTCHLRKYSQISSNPFSALGALTRIRSDSTPTRIPAPIRHNSRKKNPHLIHRERNYLKKYTRGSTKRVGGLSLGKALSGTKIGTKSAGTNSRTMQGPSPRKYYGGRGNHTGGVNKRSRMLIGGCLTGDVRVTGRYFELRAC